MDGILNLDKLAGLSSAGALNRIKRLLPRRTKLGHAGTLDPFATGVLLALVGKATRRCEILMDQSKGYDATIKLGANTPTDDPESAEVPVGTAQVPTRETLLDALGGFVGTVQQRPPAYSAVKIEGRRAYDLARGGKQVHLPARPVRIDRIELLEYLYPVVRVSVDCGRGTYIRAIARDLGEVLGTGGYLTALRRTRVGTFRAEQSVTLEQLLDDGIEAHLGPVPGDDSDSGDAE